MKALLKMDLNDWTWKGLPILKAGTEVRVVRSQDSSFSHEYMGCTTIDGQMFVFGLDFYEFDPIH